MRRLKWNRGAVAGCAALLLSLALAVPAPAQAPEPDTLRAVPLEPVVVTVLRTPLELARVPFAVAVNGPEQVQRARPGLGLDEALRGIPGLQVDNRHNYALGERISIRGFGARSQFGVRGVKVLVDGIPATLPDGQTALSHVDLGSIGRVEVIRGPASAIYGNAAGGVIHFHTEAPPPGRLRQELGVLAGGDGLLRIGSTTGGQGENTSYLLSVSHLTYDGPRDFNRAESTRLSATLGYRGERDEVRLMVHAVDYDAQNPGSLSDSLLRVDRTAAFGFNRLQQTGETGQQVQVGSRWQRTLGAGELEISGYALTRSIENPIPPAIIDLERAAGGVRALYRARLPTAMGEIVWTAGAEADGQWDDRSNFANQRGERGALSLDQEERVRSLAAFAQLSAPLASRLTALGGLRYDRFHFAAHDRLVSAANPDDTGNRAMDAVSPSFGVIFTAAEPLSLYGNVATSFETPTTTDLANRPNGAGGFNPELEPQRATSYELGARGRIGGELAYEIAAYRANISNALIPFEVPGAAGRQFFRNAGAAVHRGVEASLTLAPLPGLMLRGAYTLTRARFGESSDGDETLANNAIPGIAPHRAEAIASYSAPAGWFVALESRYASRLPVNDANTEFSPAYTVADLRAGLERVRIGRIETEPFAGVTNLFDAAYNTSVVVNAFGRRYFEPGPARSFYAGVQVRI